MSFDGMFLYLNKTHKNCVHEKLIDFYKYEAKKFIKKRIDEIAEINDLNYNNLRITSAKTRWGSCTSNRNINFTYRLIMAPVKVIDYVIIHELAHLDEMNHSKDFWDTVDKYSKNIYP
jgi:predicted metal-dependent hydrolase